MADGGTTDDFDTLDQSTRIEEIQNILKDPDSPLTQEQLVSKTDWSAAVIDVTLEPLLNRQIVMEIEDGYVLL